MMNFEEIKKYWENRAIGDSSAQSTTQDVYLREIEFSTLSDRIQKYSPRLVADVGCGDGRTTARLASKYPTAFFFGFDYSSTMVENARDIILTSKISNVEFSELDICDGLKSYYNLIYTTRCLINLPSWDLQKDAIKNIYDALTVGGVYLMIENFIEGQENFNQVRRKFGLPDIPIREHNFFFRQSQLLEYVDSLFVVDEEINISSTYYLVSRVIYSKICAESGKKPDYFDDHHRFAAGLPFSGEFGPVRLICLRKR